MASSQLTNLKNEVEVLRLQFLPDPFDPTGTYVDSARVNAHTRAFIVLAHAEFESYFEAWAKDITRAAENLWTTSRKMTTQLAFLNAINHPGKIGVNEKLGVNPVANRFSDLAVASFQSHYKVISGNNGIKECNLLPLFCALNVPETFFTTVLITNLDSLGVKRGKYAHNSSRSITIQLDPKSEYDFIKGLLAEIDIFDAKLSGFITAI